MGLLRRPPVAPRGRVLTAAGVRIDLADRQALRAARKYRQGWQGTTYDYRDSIPELRYAGDFIGNSAGRMRLFAAAYTDDPASPPVPVDDAGIGTKLAEAAKAALDRLGTGQLAIAAIMNALAVNFMFPGEANLVGRVNPDTDQEEWSIRSIDEIVTASDGYHLRELPGDFTDGQTYGDKPLDPETTFIARLWKPHPRYRRLADSPMRALLEISEELLILSRGVRAQAKSRLAGPGLLLVPDELTMAQAAPSDDNPLADPFLSALTVAMTTPILDEGHPSAVVPIVIRGPAAVLDALKHLVLTTGLDATAFTARAEIIGRMATGVDLPREIMTGMGGTNHWNAFQISSDNFRHHLEPAVLQLVDSLTQGYLWAALAADGFTPAEYRQCVVWYDPAALITHPDKTADALNLWDRNTLSNEALLDAAGFSDKDLPDGLELVSRMLTHVRTYPPNILQAIIARLDPTLQIPALAGVPASGPGQTDPAAPPAEDPNANPGAPPEPGGGAAPPGSAAPAKAAARAATRTLVASTIPRRPPKLARLGSRLTAIDHGLLTETQAAATAAVRRHLERAGARMRAILADKNPAALAAFADVSNGELCAALGPAERGKADVFAALTRAMVASTLDGRTPDFGDLERDFGVMVTAAQAQALAHVRAALADACDEADDDGCDLAPDELAALRAQQDDDRHRAWAWLLAALVGIFAARTVGTTPAGRPRPGPPGGQTALGGALVPAGVVRAALAIAGGFGAGETSPGLGPDGRPVDSGEVFGGVAVGERILTLLSTRDITADGWEWVHDNPQRDFPPHLDLDGVVSATYDGPEFDGYSEGDHGGCRCYKTPSLVRIGDGQIDAEAA